VEYASMTFNLDNGG